MCSQGRRAVVLDTSAFVAGFDPLSIAEEQFTVPLVKEEIRRSSMSWIRFKTAVDNGKLRVKTPRKFYADEVNASATVIGDKFFLSKTDLQVLALALELKANGYEVAIATDDYSIQNVAKQIGLEFVSLATFGIRFRLKWTRYCPACHRKYPSDFESGKCQVCGTRLKRKPSRKAT